MQESTITLTVGSKHFYHAAIYAVLKSHRGTRSYLNMYITVEQGWREWVMDGREREGRPERNSQWLKAIEVQSKEYKLENEYLCWIRAYLPDKVLCMDVNI